MELLLNDLSINGQFLDISGFKIAINRIMTMRQIARQYGRELYCHRNVFNAQVTQEYNLPQAIQFFKRDQQRVIMSWLSQHGPFWEDFRRHKSDEYLEFDGNVVTDFAIGEAAYCSHLGFQRDLVSMTPSSWEFSPIIVNWVTDDDSTQHLNVVNHWEVDKLESHLREASAPISSWVELEKVAKVRCPGLTFSIDSFEFLASHPFISSAATHILVLLDILNRLKYCFDEHGTRTKEGDKIFQEHFTGEKAWFTDSSPSEKNDFKKELTFRHPELGDQSLFCTWHGKVNTPKFRIHFSWPVCFDKPLYVVYVGPKITKR